MANQGRSGPWKIQVVIIKNSFIGFVSYGELDSDEVNERFEDNYMPILKDDGIYPFPDVHQCQILSKAQVCILVGDLHPMAGDNGLYVYYIRIVNNGLEESQTRIITQFALDSVQCIILAGSTLSNKSWGTSRVTC